MTLHLAVRPEAVLIEDYFAFANTLPKRAPGQRYAALQWLHRLAPGGSGKRGPWPAWRRGLSAKPPTAPRPTEPVLLQCQEVKDPVREPALQASRACFSVDGVCQN